MKHKVVTLEGKAAGEITLNDTVFGTEVRGDILHRMVEYQRAKKRAGTHKTKGISEISGTTKKPHKQKGTGQARQGSRRSPQMRGGARIFGPVVRSHALGLQKKFRKLALRTALSAKAAEGTLLVVDSLEMKSPKTQELIASLQKLDVKKVLFIDGAEVNVNFKKAAANIPYVDVLPQIGANVYDILRHEKLVLSKDAVAALEARLA